LIVRFGLRGAVYGILFSAAVYSMTMGISLHSAVRAEGRALALPIPAKPEAVS
jgi:hypothetical protein